MIHLRSFQNIAVGVALLCFPLIASAQDSLSLSDAIRQAIKNAPQIQRAIAQTDAAHARTGQIDADRSPQLTGDATYTRIDPIPTVSLPLNGKTEAFAFGPNNAYDAHLLFQQLITDFGRTSSKIAASEASEKSSKDNLDDIKSTVAYQVIQLFCGILTTEETITIEEDQKSILRGNLEITRQRLAEGTAISLDELTVETRIAGIESQEADLHAALEREQASMRRLLGIKPGTTILLKQELPEIAYANGLDDLLNSAKENRPELVQSKDAEDVARLQVESAKLSSAPTLGAAVTGGVKDGYFPDLEKPYVNWTGSLQLSVPILEGGRRDEKVAEAEANYVAAQAASSDQWQQIESEVEAALADANANKSKLGLTKIQIDEAQKALSVADARYKSGAATNLDYLTAQSQLEQAMLQDAGTKLNFALSVYNLKKAVGERVW